MPFDLPDRHLLNIADVAASFMAVLSLDKLQVIYVNQYTLDHFQIDEDSLKKTDIRNFNKNLHPTDFALLDGLIEEAEKLSDDAVLPVKFRALVNDKQWHWFQAFIRVYKRDLEGRVKWIVVSSYDINEIEATRHSFRKQTELLEKVLNTSPVPIIQVDREGKLTYVNKSAEKVLGISKSKAKNRSFDDFGWKITDFAGKPIPSEDLPFSMVKRTGNPVYGYRHLIIRSDGRKIKISINAAPLYDSQGEFEGIVASVEDITNSLRIQEALKLSERRFRKVVESSPLGIHIYELDDQDRLIFIDSNHAADRILGVDNREFMGKSLEEAFPKLMNTEIPEKYHEIAKMGIIWETEKIELIESKAKRYFELHAFQIELGTVGVMFSDVSKRYQNEAHLRTAKEQAESANRAKNDFLAVMSHEMRTPLNPIMGFTSLLLSICKDESQQIYLKMILDSSQKLMDQIQDVLDFSKIEQGQIEIEQRPFDLWNLTRKISDLMRHQARGNVINLEKYSLKEGLENSSAQEAVIGDPGKINQILMNLLTNACKFTKNGTVTLRYGIQEQIKNGNVVRFEVEDTGIGIHPKNLKNLFDPFTQVDSADSRKLGGIGLGLAICKRLVDAMGGKIGVQSEPGKGSLFWFTVSLRNRTNEEYDTRQVIEDLKINDIPVKILLAEDNLANQQVMQALLESMNCESTLAVNGLEVLQLLKEQHFDLILLDVEIPLMDGFEVTRKIRESEESFASIPIIAITAHVSEVTRLRCQACEMNDFLAKPVFLDSLKAILEKWLTVQPESTE